MYTTSDECYTRPERPLSVFRHVWSRRACDDTISNIEVWIERRSFDFCHVTLLSCKDYVIKLLADLSLSVTLGSL